jgi:tRNA-dihydrouridine synthase 1
MLSRSPLASELAGPSTSVTTPEGRKYTRQSGGAHLCYTPMIHAKVFVTSPDGGRGTDGQFNLTYAEEGSGDVLAGIEGGDRPLIVQVCFAWPSISLDADRLTVLRKRPGDTFGCSEEGGEALRRRGHQLVSGNTF